MGLRQNALVLLLLTALIAIAGDWAADAQLARLWYVPAIVLLLGLAYEGWIVSRCAPQLRLHAPPNWFLGRATPVRFEIVHRLRRSLKFEIALSAVPEVAMDRAIRVVDANNDEQVTLSFAATARRLGRYQWPATRVRAGGVLGLAWWPRLLATDGEFRVVPDIVHDSEYSRGAQAGGVQAAQRIGSGAEVLQLRDYRAGDAPRSIDWKASARSRRLISRDFSEDQQLDIIVALDAGRASAMGAGDTDRLALYANVAARLAQRAVMLDDRVGLVIYAQRPLAAMAPAHGPAALARLRSLLTEVTQQRTDSNPALAALRIRSLVRHRSLIVLLTDLDDSSLTSELRSAVRVLLPTHLPFVAGVTSDRIEAIARTAATDRLEVYRSLAAQEYVNALRRNASSLQALGAPAILASPRELDRAVLDAYLNFRRRRRI